MAYHLCHIDINHAFEKVYNRVTVNNLQMCFESILSNWKPSINVDITMVSLINHLLPPYQKPFLDSIRSVFT